MAKVAIFSSKSYDRQFLETANAQQAHSLTFFESRLSLDTVRLLTDASAICAFVNDELDANVLAGLKRAGIDLVALRCAGFNNVDLGAAQKLGITVAHVPSYSPHAVAEHMVAILLTLVRKTHRAHNRVREGNMSLDGLLGFTLEGKTVGIVGTGRIGRVVARILYGFGCRLIASDPHPNPAGVAVPIEYVSNRQLFESSDIITLHCPLTPDTHHLIDHDAIAAMKAEVVLINTSRGAVVDSSALIKGLKSRRIGALGLDVYEEEADFFFEDISNRGIQDDIFARLLTFPNVLITGHQGFFTQEAMTAIAETTIANISAFENSGQPVHIVAPT